MASAREPLRIGRVTQPRAIPVALLIALYALVLAAPLLLALLQGRPLRSPWRELGSALVMAGFVMMDSVERTLRAWGVPRAQVVAERFSYA